MMQVRGSRERVQMQSYAILVRHAELGGRCWRRNLRQVRMDLRAILPRHGDKPGK
jgi:hypothetical protein